MPLQHIPLGNFRYVGDTFYTATFKYDTRSEINKYNFRQIEKIKPIEIIKNNSDLVYKYGINVKKNKYKLLYKNKLETDYCDKKDLYIINDKIQKNIEYCLKKNNIEALNKKIKDLNRNAILGEKSKIFNIQKRYKYINFRDYYKYIYVNFLNKMNKKVIFQIKRDSTLIDKIKTNLFNIPNYKGILRKNNLIILNKLNIFNLDKNSTNVLVREFIEINRCLKYVFLIKEQEFCNMYIGLAKFNLLRLNLKGLDIYLDNLLVNKERYIDKRSNNWLFLYGAKEKRIKKVDINRLIYKKYKNIFANNQHKGFNKYHQASIQNKFVSILMYRIPKNNIFTKHLKEFSYKVSMLNLLTCNQNYLSRYSLVNVNLNDGFNLISNNKINLFESNLKVIKNVNSRSIYKYKLYRLNKSRNKVFISNEKKCIKKIKSSLNKQIYKTEFLEVVKRWWVLNVTSPFDKKILPYDFNYKDNALTINRRDKEYGTLSVLDMHPISYMPYLEQNKGSDLKYGVDEINLSIAIMLDMTNIVGMIVQHNANQFVNCSGQEAIEFIIELLLEWLRLDSTIKEMKIKSSREHYLRAYRWIRWEAEKIWVIADENHAQHKMMGLKYANMLFANLIDYMKYHHFNIVPLWKNLKFMDVEKQFNKKIANKAMVKKTDKIKGKRHYFIETKNLENKNVLGGK